MTRPAVVVNLSEMGRAAFVQMAMAQIMGAMLGARVSDPTLFPPETRKVPDYSNPLISDGELRRCAQISVEAAEALLRAYGPFGFAEPDEDGHWSWGATDARSAT